MLALLAQAESLSVWSRLASFALSNVGRMSLFVLLSSVALLLLLPPASKRWQFSWGGLLALAAAATLVWVLVSPQRSTSTQEVSTGAAISSPRVDAASEGLHLRGARLGRNTSGDQLLTINITPRQPAGQSTLLATMALTVLTALVVFAALGTICSRSPVYSAIWFAVTILGVGAFMLQSGAQFLGLATVAVYAGAIVVTFLFVLMLSQPEGHAYYDRIGWGRLPKLAAVLAGTSMTGIILVQFAAVAWGASETQTGDDGLSTVISRALQDLGPVTLPDDEATIAAAIRNEVGSRIDPNCEIDVRDPGVLSTHHVASFGGQLFSRHLISVQIAGALLLVALVGAIAMASYGSEPQ